MSLCLITGKVFGKGESTTFSWRSSSCRETTFATGDRRRNIGSATVFFYSYALGMAFRDRSHAPSMEPVFAHRNSTFDVKLFYNMLILFLHNCASAKVSSTGVDCRLSGKSRQLGAR
eukprot:1196169-Prorocentrum_minimum.AAC.2